MNDDQKNTEEAPTPEGGQPEPGAASGTDPIPQPAITPDAAAAMASGDVEDGKAFAILSYALNFIGLPFFLVPLIMRNNVYALYHAKQCMMIWLVGVVGSVVSTILSAVCIGLILFPIIGIFLLVVNIMGLINATKGEARPLVLIGKWGEDWFKGITKA